MSLPGWAWLAFGVGTGVIFGAIALLLYANPFRNWPK